MLFTCVCYSRWARFLGPGNYFGYEPDAELYAETLSEARAEERHQKDLQSYEAATVNSVRWIRVLYSGFHRKVKLDGVYTIAIIYSVTCHNLVLEPLRFFLRVQCNTVIVVRNRIRGHGFDRV